MALGLLPDVGECNLSLSKLKINVCWNGVNKFEQQAQFCNCTDQWFRQLIKLYRILYGLLKHIYLTHENRMKSTLEPHIYEGSRQKEYK